MDGGREKDCAAAFEFRRREATASIRRTSVRKPTRSSTASRKSSATGGIVTFAKNRRLSIRHGGTYVPLDENRQDSYFELVGRLGRKAEGRQDSRAGIRHHLFQRVQ